MDTDILNLIQYFYKLLRLITLSTADFGICLQAVFMFELSTRNLNWYNG